MFFLPHGCYISGEGPGVHPKNWKNKNASIRGIWYLSYRFYDPSIPGKKQIIIKGGVNEYKTLEARQLAMKTLIATEMEILQKGYNPIKNLIIPIQEEKTGEISPQTPFISALLFALSIKQCEPTTRTDIKSILKYFEQSAIMLGRSNIPIQDIKRRDIRLILDNCKNVTVLDKSGKTKSKLWNNNQFNHYRKYLSVLYKELEELEIVEYNPVEKIAIRETIERIRQVLTDRERVLLKENLKEQDPCFWRFINIFFHSGSRRAELYRLQGKDVDMLNQRFKILVRKGKRKREIWKTIKDIAVPYWNEVMEICKPEDYVFSLNFMPGTKHLLPEYATRRWHKEVKEKLGISADFYSLKHLHTTELIDIIQEDSAMAAAADHNSHTSTAMVVTIYDVKSKERRHNKVKTINNSFA
jgi:integrase